MTSLQDALPTFNDAEAFELVEAELGRPLEEMFAMITPSPIAAASLGQVYRATLLDGGQEVALKVQRPNIPIGLELDFHIIRVGSMFADRFVDALTTSIVDLVVGSRARVTARAQITHAHAHSHGHTCANHTRTRPRTRPHMCHRTRQ